MVSVSICLTAPHTIPARFLNYLFPLIEHTRRNGIEVRISISNHYITYHARNNCVISSSKTNPDYLFFLDVDVFASPKTIQKLIEKEKNIISGPYHMKAAPYQPQAYKQKENDAYELMKITEKKVVEVDACGTGCLLIKKEVFEKIGFPYFFCVDEGKEIGEDLFFCRKAKKAGYRIYYDNTIEGVAHFGAAIGKKDFDKWKDEFIP
jgi:GT2 family glycosyltransferase